MMTLYLYIRTWLQSRDSEEGQDLVEYALLLGLIALAALVAITASGDAINAIWEAVQAALEAAAP